MSTVKSVTTPKKWTERILEWTIKGVLSLFAIIGLAENLLVIKEEVAPKIRVDVSIANPSATKIDFVEEGSKVKIEVDLAVYLTLTNFYSKPINIDTIGVQTLCSIGKDKWTEVSIESLENGSLHCFNKQQKLEIYPIPLGSNLGAKLKSTAIEPGASIEGWLVCNLPRKSLNHIEQIKISLHTHEGDYKEVLIVIPKIVQATIKPRKQTTRRTS